MDEMYADMMTKAQEAAQAFQKAQNEGESEAVIKAKYEVIIGSRTLEKAKESEKLLGNSVIGMMNKEAAAAGGIVILTVPFAHQQGILNECKEEIDGKLFIERKD